MSDSAALVIVGTGLAGYNLAREFRKLDKVRELVLISADDGRFYSKPMLSTGFAKGKSAEQLVMQEAGSMATELNARIMTDTCIERIDPVSKTLHWQGGQQAYGELVLACGAHARALPGAEALADHLLSINNLQDYARFRARLGERQRVLIIGAGLIGCEFANDLAAAGIQVQVVAPDVQVMPGLLPLAVATAVKTGLESLGVRFHLGRTVTALQTTPEGLEAQLDDGQRLQADIGLSAIGLIANTQLAQAAGLTCGRGIQVDRQLRSSNPQIYALGDCAEVAGLNLMYVMPLMAAARALAQTLAGNPTELSYGPMPVMVKTPACPLVVSPPVTCKEGEWQVSGSGADISALFHDPQGVLHGYALTGSCVSEKLQLNRQLPPWLA